MTSKLKSIDDLIRGATSAVTSKLQSLNRPKTLASANQNTANLRNTIANFRVAPDKPTLSQAWQSSLQNNLPALMARGQSFGNERIDRLVNPVVKPAGQMAGGLISGLSLGFVNPTKNIEPTNRIERGANIAGNVMGVFNPIGAGNQILGRVGTLGTKWGSNLAVRAGAPTASKAIGALLGEAAQTGTMLTASKATGREFNPVTDLAFGLGTRGALGTLYKGLSRGVPKGHSPRINRIIPMDGYDTREALEIINSKTTSRAEKQDAWVTLQNITEAYMPGLKNSTNAQVKKAAEDFLTRFQRQQDNFDIPKMGGVNDVPGGMGFAGAQAPRRVKQGLKTEKFALSKVQQKTVAQLQQKLGLGTRKVRSFEDMRELANDLGTDPQRLLRDIENGRITDKEVIALGDVISTSTKRITTLTRKLKANPSDDALRTQLQAEENLLNNALSKRIKGGTEAGRAVASFRIIANRTMDPAYWLDKAKRQVGEQNVPADVVTAINGYIKKNDRLGLAQFVAQLGESSGWEKAVSLWKAGLLTGFRTHEANIISNAAFGALETAKDLPATAFDVARSAITGGSRAKTVSLSQIGRQVPGAIRGAHEGAEYFRTGIDPNDINRQELQKPLRYGDSVLGKIAQTYTNTIFRGLGTADKVFFRANFERSLAEQLKLARINGKLTKEQLETLRRHPSAEMLTRAEMDARYATFTKENALSDAIKGAKRATSPGVRAGIDFVVPFTRTPTNVAEALLDYSPAGFLKDLVKSVVSKGSVDNKRLAESFGRSVTGTGIAWVGYELAKHGLITGASPSGQAERAQNDLEGESAGSILVDGKWRQMSRISPVGNLLILGAEAYKNNLDPVKTGFAAAKAVTDQTFLKGLSSGIKAVTEPDRFASSFVENSVSGLIPSLSSDIARGMDEYQRSPEGVTQRIMTRLPGLRERVPVKLNQLGEPIAQEGGMAGALFDPFNSRTPNADPLVQELKRVGYNLNYVGDEIGGEKLTQAQQQEYQRRAGEHIKTLLPGVIESSSYQAVDSDKQRDVLERVVNRAKDLAREELKAGGLENITASGGQVEASGGTSGKTKPYVYYDAEKDQVQVIEMDFELEAPKLTGNTELDKKLISSYKGKITSKANDVVKLYEQGVITAEQAEALLNDLEAQRDKVAGGSGKGKKLSNMPTLKIDTPKSGSSSSGGQSAQLGVVRKLRLADAKPIVAPRLQ